MTTARFYVVTVNGYTINPDSSSRGMLCTSYSVLDAAQNHREVVTRYGGGNRRTHGREDSRRRDECEREARRRNALDGAGCPA